MTQVHCDVTSCSYNKDYGCHMDPINVGGKGASFENLTCCGSYLNKHTYSNLAEYTYRRGEADTVHCNVSSCKYNESQLCSKDHIDICGSKETDYYMDTNCGSFEKQC